MKGRPPHVPGGLQFRTQLACETCQLGFGAANCGQAFARETVARGHPSNQIIQGSVTVKG